MRLKSRSSLVLLLALVCAAEGQEGVSPGRPPTGLGQGGLSTTILDTGAVTLNVQILGENNTRLDVQALVRVRDPITSSEKWDVARQKGEASIPGLYQGKFDLEVSALGYETSTTHIELFGLHTEATRVVLKKDLNAESYTPSDTNVSRKAREASERGLTALQLGRTKDAEKNLRDALKEAPQSAQIHYLLGVLLLQRKATDEADKSFQEAIAADPRHVPALTALGGLRLQQKNYPVAGDLLQRAVAANPRQWRAHWLLANVRLFQQQFEPALAEAKQAVDLSQGAPQATLALGEALGSLGRNSEAVLALRRFLEQAPTSSDAPAVRQMIATLENPRGIDAPVTRPVAMNLAAATSRAAPALALMSPAWMPPGVDDMLPPVAAGVTCPLERVLAGVGQSMKEIGTTLDRYSATETQVHETMDLLGNPHGREERKSGYLVELSQPIPGFLQVSEMRPDLIGAKGFGDGVVTSGLLGLAFLFHPTMQVNYEMTCEGLGEWAGQPAWLVHFRQRPEKPRRVQSFKNGSQIYGVPLKGRAWIGAASFQLLRIEAELTEPMREAQLTQEHQVGEYGPVDFKAKNTQLWLPKDTSVYLEFHGHRYRVTDHFEDYVLFSVDSQQKDKLPPPKDN